ncbi:MAG: aminotransferase class I/II-fold pyridoxal phosphate-dependent enzyme, partial [Anaerolineae bacterium]|nr:aminotransferase class I/II-fold pyridoxal phosphate-dependent enzyme [Anaerolineae bacterium]
LGSVPDEFMRRKLRILSTKRPLFFIEANNAPNHLSLAREARLVQVVIRLLSPEIFSPRLHHLSTVFVAGNAEFLRAIESVHFNLKGTPSASEVEFLTFLLEQQLVKSPTNGRSAIPDARPPAEGLMVGHTTFSALPHLAQRTERHLEELLSNHTHLLGHSLDALADKTTLFTRRIQNAWKTRHFDAFAGVEVRELLDHLVGSLDRMDTIQALEGSFLSAFVRHQPQYQPESCVVVSGSSRTGLGILGFHCGITDVVIPDLSWSYEQCFPHIHVVPLTESLALDAEAMIEKVEELCRRDPAWRQRGAMVLNNPHNATGRIFAEEAIQKLILYCLENDIYFIDDLAYQNMVPANELPEIKTLRQITSELVWLGLADAQRADRVISVHSVSKTDCSAGSRLAVVEIRDPQLRQQFEQANAQIKPNLAAILISYLFYRSSVQAVRT